MVATYQPENTHCIGTKSSCLSYAIEIVREISVKVDMNIEMRNKMIFKVGMS